jgi:hypothetical protein
MSDEQTTWRVGRLKGMLHDNLLALAASIFWHKHGGFTHTPLCPSAMEFAVVTFFSALKHFGGKFIVTLIGLLPDTLRAVGDVLSTVWAVDTRKSKSPWIRICSKLAFWTIAVLVTLFTLRFVYCVVLTPGCYFAARAEWQDKANMLKMCQSAGGLTMGYCDIAKLHAEEQALSHTVSNAFADAWRMSSSISPEVILDFARSMPHIAASYFLGVVRLGAYAVILFCSSTFLMFYIGHKHAEALKQE